ncbi:MAG: metallophosphoesterase [Egibacteraceae bacterium]
MTDAWRRAALAVGVVGGACLAWAGLVERRWYALRHATVPVLRPGAMRPLRILHLSDLHQRAGHDHRLTFVRACAATAPDLVVVTGDLLESDSGIAPVIMALAAALDGRPGVAVLGAHDVWGPSAKNPLEYLVAPGRRKYGRRLDTASLVEGLSDGGYEVLGNRRQTIKTPAGLVDVAGLGDRHADLDRPEEIDWSPPTEDVVLRLGLAHAPYRGVLDVFDRHGFDLALCGHTHGGQLRLPLLGALVNNTDLPLRHSRGLSRVGADLWLHVSAGLGHSTFWPIRFSCRPEATLLDLVPAQG